MVSPHKDDCRNSHGSWPRSWGIALAAVVFILMSPGAALGLEPATDAFQAEAAALHAAAASTAIEVALPCQGVYYWLGDTLYVDGLVTNDSAASVGPVAVRIRVTAPDETLVVDEVVYAAIYNLRPETAAAFSGAFALPAISGATVGIALQASGVQPCQYPNVIDFVLHGGDVSVNPDGTRAWITVWSNNSPYPADAAVLGGWEFDDAGILLNCPVEFTGSVGLQVASYGSLRIDTTAHNPGAVPADRTVYCQALRVMHDALLPVYRVYDMRTMSHLYSTSRTEVGSIVGREPRRFVDEGVAYNFDMFNNTMQLFRFINLQTGGHFYTADPLEIDLVLTKLSAFYRCEGPTYKVNLEPVPDSLAVHRFYNVRNGNHFFTANAEEAELVKARLSHIWRYEGVAFWVGQ